MSGHEFTPGGECERVLAKIKNHEYVPAQEIIDASWYDAKQEQRPKIIRMWTIIGIVIFVTLILWGFAMWSIL